MKSKQTKRALTGSVLALVLCFVMLLGTTFAWFTDNASTSVNKVQAGTLDVALEMKEGTNWVSAEGKTLDFVKAAGAANDEAVLWEPGCTYKLPELRIVNNGNLALKYEVYLTVTGDTALSKVIDVTAKDANSKSLFKGRDDEGNEATLDTMTLSDVLAAAKLPSDINNKTANAAIKGKLAGGADTGAISISMTMQSSAGNACQGLSIDGIAVTVVATQDTVESDSNNNQYDKDAAFSTVLDADTNGEFKTGTYENQLIVGTVKFNQKELGEDEKLTFKNCTFIGTVGGAGSHDEGNIEFVDCTFLGVVHINNPKYYKTTTSTGAQTSGESYGGVITFDGCHFGSNSIFRLAGGAESVTIKNSTFEPVTTTAAATDEDKALLLYSNVSFENCKVARPLHVGLPVDSSGITITFKDCTDVPEQSAITADNGVTASRSETDNTTITVTTTAKSE